ncbi:MAG: hypothetical protein IKP81_10105 [Paludibacteraceae bacterium]|nr:hypothetical protein [Paludibacteraceae bacterium]
MITITHNFDGSKFMWLWAQYVKAGRIEKHCIGSIPGKLSKKFSGTSNKDFANQPCLVMDEVADGEYEAIYFCGVVKKGYLNPNPLKNNYRHNVHFAVVPVDGARDVWDFENWHVEIEGGRIERIPATYELKPKFFNPPYDSHYYTCRIFRWMVGHFYQNELLHADFNVSEIEEGKKYAEAAYMAEVRNDTQFGGYWTQLADQLKKETGFLAITDLKFKSEVYKKDKFDKARFVDVVLQSALQQGLVHDQLYFAIGIEEYMEMLYPYQARTHIL